MPIEYSLRENRLTPEPDDYVALVSSSRSVELQEVVDRMVAQGSSITSADILSVFDNFEKALESLLAEGANVNLPFANFSSSIKGVFIGSGDSFDPSRHQITPVVNAGPALRSAYDQRMSAVKKEASVTTPNLVEYLDFNSGDRNSTVTKGGLGQISGHRLKFDPEDANQGIFFIDSQGQETKVTVVGENKPARLMFMIPPNLSTGDATLSVRTAIGQDIRSGSLSATLSVTA